MIAVSGQLQSLKDLCTDGIIEIWDNLWKNNLWKRMLKNVICTTTVVSICLIPGSRDALGKAAYLGAIATVFAHPGRRFGQMAEALILALGGTLFGVAWSLFGIYLGSLVINTNPPAAYTIRGVFLLLATLLHGFLRSRTPRLFVFVLLMIICSVVSLTGVSKTVTKQAATQILYPILVAGGVILVVNLFVFPEFSSGFLGQTTIETLDEIVKLLSDSGDYFVGSSKPEDGKVSAEEPQSTGLDTSSNESDNASKKAKVSYAARFTAGLKSMFHNSKKASGSEPHEKEVIGVSSLTSGKATIRQKVGNCKATQSECSFELFLSELPPYDLKPISVDSMNKLAANVITVIGACESKFALLGEEAADKETQNKNSKDKNEGVKPEPSNTAVESKPVSSSNQIVLSDDQANYKDQDGTAEEAKSELELLKPRREIEFGDARLLEYLLRRIAGPYREAQSVISRTVEVIISCLAYCYGVPKPPSGARAPKGIELEELDLHLDILQRAMARFDVDTASAIESSAMIQDIQGLEPDIMPREEIFLISSFVLNTRQAAAHIEAMLQHTYELVSKRQQHKRRRLYAPHIKLGSWLSTGGDEEEAMPATGRKANRKGAVNDRADESTDGQSISSRKGLLAENSNTNDLEKNAKQNQPQPPKETVEKPIAAVKEAEAAKQSFRLRARGKAADALEWMVDSEDLLYAIKMAISVFLVLWPAFVYRWNAWFSLNRGLWAGLQLIFITEVSIGNSIWIFFLRAIGTTLGCLWGWAAFEAHHGNRIVCAAMICVGIFPFAYVQLATPYPKAGMVAIVSMCVVSLATELGTVPGSATENFLKRYIAFMIGGCVAVLVQLAVLPVKARTRLVESLAAAVEQINEMEKCIAFGIEAGVKIDVFNAVTYDQFLHASGKANTALAAAETFLPVCDKEPRLKGSFEPLGLIYTELIFVLHQIIDRMENMLQLRTAYGSGPLEELNAEIFPYRRNVAGAITNTLFVIQCALATKLPLPQFLPSARLAHLRMINRVREVVQDKAREKDESQEVTAKLARQRAVRRKYMAWNASSAAQAEVIEFLEELIDLTKLLVGANEFNSGLLTRENYRKYATQTDEDEEDQGEGDGGGRPSKRTLEPIQSSDEATPAAATIDSGETNDEEEMRDQFSENTVPESSTGAVGGGVVRRRKTSVTAQPETDTSQPGQQRRRRGTTVTSSKTSASASASASGSASATAVSLSLVGSGDTDDNVPASLKRIQTRKIEAGRLRRQRTGGDNNEDGKKTGGDELSKQASSR